MTNPTTKQVLWVALSALAVALIVLTSVALARPGLLQTELLRDYYLSQGDEGIYRAFRIRLDKYTQIRNVSFMGKGLLMHEVTREPLRCVERYIKQHCSEPYTRMAALFRVVADIVDELSDAADLERIYSNWSTDLAPKTALANVTFETAFRNLVTNRPRDHPSRVCCGAPRTRSKPRATTSARSNSNHIFGLALDINPLQNPCCGCVKDWAKSPLCLPENGAKTFDQGAPMGAYDLPECWIQAFKANGWHWLGDDALRDTMHFEFLAQPGAITCD